MQYRVLWKISQPMGRARCEVDAPVPVGVGFEFAGPVTGEITLTNAGSAVSARGRLKATVICECSRCLAAHPVELDVAVDEECRLAQIDQPVRGGEGEPEPIPILDEDRVDLSELVRQVLSLSVPPRSLCGPDCMGLCPGCGRNLNQQACVCAREPSRGLPAGLRNLKLET